MEVVWMPIPVHLATEVQQLINNRSPVAVLSAGPGDPGAGESHEDMLQPGVVDLFTVVVRSWLAAKQLLGDLFAVGVMFMATLVVSGWFRWLLERFTLAVRTGGSCWGYSMELIWCFVCSEPSWHGKTMARFCRLCSTRQDGADDVKLLVKVRGHAKLPRFASTGRPWVTMGEDLWIR
eukprot:Skav216393  [mRNA]  locus=scaffold457:77136:77867:+ [translate_table: standard]